MTYVRRSLGTARNRVTLAVSISVCALAPPAPLIAQQGFGARFGMGYQDLGGEYGEVLEGHVDGEASLMYAHRGARLGFGWNWVSFGMDNVEHETWNQTKGHILAGYAISTGSSLRPYAEVRYTYHRIRPEGRRFDGDGDALQQISTFRATGSGWEVVVGVEVLLSQRTSLDLAAGFGTFEAQPNLSSQGLGPVETGSWWRAQTGVTWFLSR